MKIQGVVLTFVVSSCAAFFAWVLVFLLEFPFVAATTNVHFVAADGDCGGLVPCYSTIQAAVNAAQSEDVVKVSGGTYVGSGLEVVSISKPLTVLGGYSKSDWLQQRPSSNKSIVDGQNHSRRGFYLYSTSPLKITVSGFHIQNTTTAIHIADGNVDVQSNTIAGVRSLSGGTSGVYVVTGTVQIRSNNVTNVLASCDWRVRSEAISVNGGSATIVSNLIERVSYSSSSCSYTNLEGIRTSDASVSISSNRIANVKGRGITVIFNDVAPVRYALVNSNSLLDNSAYAVAIYCVSERSLSSVQISRNQILRNGSPLSIRDCTTADVTGNLFEGGDGVYIERTTGTVTGNVFRGLSSYVGGAMYLEANQLLVENNLFENNFSSTAGGAIYAFRTDLTTKANRFIGNRSIQGGSAIYYTLAGNLQGENDLFAQNITSGSQYAAVEFSGGTSDIRHWTLADNGSIGIYNKGTGAMTVTDSIVSGHSVVGLAGAGLIGRNVLFYANGADCSSGAQCEASVVGNPAFADPTNLDYHIGPGSMAVDLATLSDISVDYEGDVRPIGSASDIGADEQPMPPSVSFEVLDSTWVHNDLVITNTTAVTGEITYLWDFGNGMTSTMASPSYQYPVQGDYTITLQGRNYGGSDSTSKVATVYGAEFESSSPDWLGQLSTFTNTSVVGNTGAYTWSLGDDTSSNLTAPAHQYQAPGEYTVVLTASNEKGMDTISKTLVVYGPPQVDWQVFPTSGARPLRIVYTASVVTVPGGDPTVTYLWDWGNGDSSITPSSVYTYPSTGVFTVSLTAGNAAGQDTVTRTEYITVYEPVVAGFSASPEQGVAPLGVSFTNTSSGDYDSVLWSFGDGGTSQESSPVYTYTVPGKYPVVLTAIGPGGQDTVTRTEYITVYEPVVAGFSASPEQGVAPLGVSFTNTSSGDYDSVLWSFGDGGTSQESSPVYTYTVPGTYTVSLQSIGLGGTDVLTSERPISVYEPTQADFISSLTRGSLPHTVFFTSTSTGNIHSLSWSFGDGHTGSGLTAQHTYVVEGIFSVILTASGLGGTDMITKPTYIEVFAPQGREELFLPYIER